MLIQAYELQQQQQHVETKQAFTSCSVYFGNISAHSRTVIRK